MEGAMPPGAMSASRGEEYASGGCAEELPMLVVPPGRMVGFGIIVSLSMVALALVHFTLKLLNLKLCMVHELLLPQRLFV